MAVQQQRLEKLKAPFPAKEGKYVPHTFPDASSGLFGRELPGRWMTQSEILAHYRRFISQYRFFGGRGLQRNWIGQRVHGVIKRLLRKPLPGWYDTRHAFLRGCPTSSRGEFACLHASKHDDEQPAQSFRVWNSAVLIWGTNGFRFGPLAPSSPSPAAACQ
jgi:hypothetical protein